MALGEALDRKWYLRPDTWLQVAVFVLALGVYTATLGPTIDFWDTAEYVTTSHIVGVPHQPGTPLYVIMGRVFDVMFGQPDVTQPSMRTAWAVNFMSALFSALAVMMVYLIIVRVARRSDPDSGWLARAGGLVGSLFLLFSQTYWNNAIEAEVYGLAAFMMTTLTWVGLVWYDHRTERRSDWLLLLLVYLCGLGVGFHLGSLLVYPAIFFMVWLATDRQLPVFDLTLVSAGIALFLASTTFVTDGNVLVWLISLYAAGCLLRAFWPLIQQALGRETEGDVRVRPFALFGLLLFVVGLSVHAVLMIRAGAVPEPAINQTIPKDFQTLLEVVRRTQYPPLNPLERQADVGYQISYYYGFFMRQFSFLPATLESRVLFDGNLFGFIPMKLTLDHLSVLIGPVMLAILGLVHTVRRARPLVWLLVLAYAINADLLSGYLNFTDHEVRERDYFYFAAFLFSSVFIGLGAAALLRWTSGTLGPSQEKLERAVAAPPPGKPFILEAFVYRVVLAFVMALLLLAVIQDDTKETWLGLFLFGGVFLGLGLAPLVDSLAGPKRGASAPAAWHERDHAFRWIVGPALAVFALIGAVAVRLFAGSAPDQVFVLGVYVAVFGGLFLGYGERRGGPRPTVRSETPKPVTVDGLTRIAAVLLVVLAALPVTGGLGLWDHDKWYTHDRSENRIAYEYAYNILAGLDENAIIFTNGDNDTFPIWYLQEVEHFRRDVTVVNLSLVNLGWYVKQLKRLENPVTLTYSDDEIDELKAVFYRDPETGQPVLVMVREYVVRDIIAANRVIREPRPVFFAVTIPRENMEHYYPFLEMEGLAYRLTSERNEDGLPGTEPARLLANVFGAYSFDALTDGDSELRRRTFTAQAGWSSDQPVSHFLTGLEEPPPVDYDLMLELVGRSRTDVYRDPNTVNLLGNYPASIARAGFGYLSKAEELRQPDGSMAAADTVQYDNFTDQAVFCYELARVFDPTNALVAAGYYPSLLLERGRIDDALIYLDEIHGRIAPDLERSAVLAAMRGLVAINETAAAQTWLEQKISDEPAWRLGYELLFRIHEAAGDVNKAAEIVDRYRSENGSDDPALRNGIDEMRRRARLLEQQRLEQEIRDSGALEGDR